MRGHDYVLEKAQSRYRSVWRDALLGADSGAYTVALDPPASSAITAHAGEVSAWLIRWRQWAAQHPDVTLRTRTIRTKFGAQPIHTHLDIPGTPALAGLNPDTAAHWQRARARWDQLRGHQAGPAVRPWLARIVDLDDYDFTTLLDATAWFRAHPRSGLTVRSVPVPRSTPTRSSLWRTRNLPLPGVTRLGWWSSIPWATTPTSSAASCGSDTVRPAHRDIGTPAVALTCCVTAG